MAADTIFALSSGRPPAAIAIVRISGPLAHRAAEHIAGPLPPPRHAALRRLTDPASGLLLDEALVLRFDAPDSSTGEHVVELHCHGGRAVVDGVLRCLAAEPGLRVAQPGEFTRRALANGRIDLTQAEGLADLLEAETEAQRRAAMQLAGGGLSTAVEQWRDRLVDLSARAERAIDYADEDQTEENDPGLRGDCGSLAGLLGEWLARPRAEPLKDGIRIVAAGPPNAGKSSLINAIAGFDRAIVSATPGTTRDSIDLPLALAGLPVVLTDTAGLRATGDPVEAEGVARAAALARSADVLLWLGDGEPPDHPRTMLVHARADLPGREAAPPGRIAVSARTGAGLDRLLAQISAMVAALLPPEGAIALNRRQAEHIARASEALAEAAGTTDLAMAADALRRARAEFDRLTGRAGVEDVLDSLFGRFCLGK